MVRKEAWFLPQVTGLKQVHVYMKPEDVSDVVGRCCDRDALVPEN